MKEVAPGYVSMFEQASPEAMRAQRMQELKDLAEYRARKIQAYKDWSDPEKRAAIQAQAEQDRIFSQELWEENQVAQEAARLRYIQDFDKMVKITEFKKAEKKGWWAWIRAFFSKG